MSTTTDGALASGSPANSGGTATSGGPATTVTSIFGIDIGGSGIKGAPVVVAEGRLVEAPPSRHASARDPGSHGGNGRGGRSVFLVDRACGYHAPGRGDQRDDAHGGEHR